MGEPREVAGSVLASQALAPGSKVAAGLLVALVVLSPWPFGSASLRATQAIALTGLLTSLVLCVRPGALDRATRFPWSLVVLWLVAALQLVPLPRGMHTWLAPGSAAIWYPTDPTAAQVLGDGPHPVSVFPEATARWLAFSTGVVSLALLAAPALRDRRRALHAALVVLAGGVAVAIYGLVARLFCGDKLYCILSVPTIAPFGPFVSKNHFAGYVEMAALLGVGVAAGLSDEARTGPERLSWIASPRAATVLFAWAAPIVLILAVPVSLSRGGVVSLAAGLLAFVLLRLRVRGRGWSSGVTLALGAAIGVAGLVAVLPFEARARILTLTGITADRSGAYRLAVWSDTLRLAASSPGVGSGFGAYADAIPRFKTAAGELRVEHAENDYLEVLAEGGAAGALLMFALALLVIARGLRNIRSEPHRFPRALRTGALSGVVAMLVHSAFDFNLRVPSNVLLFVMLVALALAPVGGQAGGRQRRSQVATFALAMSLVVALTTPWTESRLDTGGVTRLSSAAPTGLRWRAVRDQLRTHLRCRPADAPAWIMLAWLRAPSSEAEAAALARWGAALDPRHEGLQRAAWGLMRPAERARASP